MNYNQYVCNMKQLFLAHTINYEWLGFWLGDRNSYSYGTEITINVRYDWSISISLFMEDRNYFLIGRYEEGRYDKRITLDLFDLVVYFK